MHIYIYASHIHKIQTLQMGRIFMLPLAGFHQSSSLPFLWMIKLQVSSLLKPYWKTPMTTASEYQTKGKELIHLCKLHET